MTPERFEQYLLHPSRTREEMETMRDNAKSKGAVELAKLAQDVIAERFGVVKSQRIGPTPTITVFLGTEELHSTGKDAYLWLLSRFANQRPETFASYAASQRRAGKKVMRVAEHPEQLFPEGSARLHNKANYAHLPNGWFADINLNHTDKFSVLAHLSYFAGLTAESSQSC